MTEKDSQGVVYTKENNYYIVGTNEQQNNNAASTLNFIVLPSSFKGLTLKIIGVYAFRESKTLKSIFIPNSIEEIRYDGFSNAVNLEIVQFAANSKLKSLGTGAFYYTKIVNIVIPPSVKYFGTNCFGGSQIDTLFICGIPKIINSYIFGKTVDTKFISFPNHLYVNNRFPYSSFGEFENITRSNACQLKERTCRNSKKTFSVMPNAIILLLC